MHSLPKTLLAIIVVLCLSDKLFGQKEPIKFGKIDIENLKKSQFDIDPEAEAIIIVDFGKSWFEYENSAGKFDYKYTRTTRIKIIKKEGYDRANISVDIFEGSGGDREILKDIKGYTYNLENGKVVKSKLDKANIFEDRVTESWRRVTFTLPDVKEGSIIEYQYTIDSPFLTEFRPWNFQHTIPVLHTEYRALIPEYFNYKQIQQGYASFFTETDKVTEEFTMTYKTAPVGGQLEERTTTYESYSNKYRWWAKDIESIKAEPFMSSLENYFSRIEFILSFTKSPNGAINDYMGDYNSFNTTLLEGNSYGKQLVGGGFLDEIVNEIKSKSTSQKEELINSYNYIRGHMVWTGGYGKYVTQNLKGAYKERSGNVADINLLLILMLKKAGLSADPVVLSSRDSYKMHPVYPISSKINYVIARVIIDDEVIYLDATDKNRPYNILPERALNGRGWVISKTNPTWVDISNDEKFESTEVVKLQIDNGLLSGSYEKADKNLLAIKSQQAYSHSKETIEEKYLNSAYWNVSDLSFYAEADYSKFTHKLTFESEDPSHEETLYVDPVIFSNLEENPFKLNERKFPVEFVCKAKKLYMIAFEIPSDYLVDELPGSSAFSLPSNAAQFVYSVSQSDSHINITIQLLLNTAYFSQSEYPNLKEFYSLITAKCSEQIVLKRKS